MTSSSLKERFARLGRVRDIDRERSGSPVVLVLRPERKRIDTVSASMTLAKRGLSMLRAKRNIELVFGGNEIAVRLPNVESVDTVVSELRAAGIRTARILHDPPSDVPGWLKAMRARLGMTQEQFALRFGFDLDALQNWEQGRRPPERTIISYLRVIDRDMQAAALAQEEDLSEHVFGTAN